jgi:hypothetical protein
MKNPNSQIFEYQANLICERFPEELHDYIRLKMKHLEIRHQNLLDEFDFVSEQSQIRFEKLKNSLGLCLQDVTSSVDDVLRFIEDDWANMVNDYVTYQTGYLQRLEEELEQRVKGY